MPQLAESLSKADDESSKRMSTVSSMGLEEIIAFNTTTVDNESILIGAEVRRSKSRVRSYLKKCKDAIIGGASHDDTANGDHREAICQRATSSWYVNEVPSTLHEAEQPPQPEFKLCESEANVVVVKIEEPTPCTEIANSNVIVPVSNETDAGDQSTPSGTAVDGADDTVSLRSVFLFFVCHSQMHGVCMVWMVWA